MHTLMYTYTDPSTIYLYIHNAEKEKERKKNKVQYRNALEPYFKDNIDHLQAPEPKIDTSINHYWSHYLIR